MPLSGAAPDPENELFGDPRFLRGRCGFDGKVYHADQTALFILTRKADMHQKIVRLCFRCSHSMPDNFIATKVAKQDLQDLD
jgi:hypothetical protein